MSSENNERPYTPTGKQLKAARALLDMKQEDLANAAGVAKSTLDNWESGRTTPTRATATMVIQALERRGITIKNGSAPTITQDPSKADIPV